VVRRGSAVDLSGNAFSSRRPKRTSRVNGSRGISRPDRRPPLRDVTGPNAKFAYRVQEQTEVVAAGAERSTASSRRSSRRGSRAAEPGGMNREVHFDSFVIGSSNRFAPRGRAGRGGSARTGVQPLFIYGGTGSERLISSRRSPSTSPSTPASSPSSTSRANLHERLHQTRCGTSGSRASTAISGRTTCC